MSEDTSEGSFLKLPRLENSIHSYVKWSKKLETYLKGDVKFTKVVAFAIKENDEVLQDFEELLGASAQVRDQNKLRMDRKDKFETACGAFIGKLLQTISEPVKRMLERRADYDEMVTKDDARGFWKMIRKEMIERNGNAANLDQARKFILRVKQERGRDYKQRRNLAKPSEEEQQINTICYDLSHRIDVECRFDLVYVASEIAVVMVIKPHNYLLSTWIEDRTYEKVLEAVVFLVSKARSGNGVDRVTSVHVDRETSANAMEQHLAVELGVMLKQAVPYSHERYIERQVRTLRNRHRCILGELKVPLTMTLRRLAFEHVVKASNFIVNSNSRGYIPYQIQMMTEDYRTPPVFGEFVVAAVGKVKSKEAPRRQIGIIVGFEEATRAVLVKFKDQAKPLVRDSYRVIDQREGFERYMENYEDYDDEVEPDELLQPIDTATLMNVLANHGGIGEKVEEILAELAGGENNTQAQDITELGEGDMEKNSTNAPIVTELDGPNLRRSTRQAKPNQKVDFIYATEEQDETTKFMNLLLNDLDYICGLV